MEQLFSNFTKTGVIPGKKHGQAAGRTLIRDKDVQALFWNVIVSLPFLWSEKQFQIAVSKKLVEQCLLKPNTNSGKIPLHFGYLNWG